MPAKKYECRLLLPAQTPEDDGGARDGGCGEAGSPPYSLTSTTGSETDSDEEEETLSAAALERGRVALKSVMYASAPSKWKWLDLLRPSKRRCRWRSVCRVLPCILLAPMLFLMLYMPLYPNIQTRQAPLRDWGYNTSRNLADYVLPENDTTLLEPRMYHDKLFLLVIVCSSMQNFAIRQTIRETWGNTTQFNYGMFAQLHNGLRGQYLEPVQERLEFYSEYLHKSGNGTTSLPSLIPVRVLFLVGRSQGDTPQAVETLARIRNEAALYDDIIQENFIDTYNNLTLKSVMALKWISRHHLRRVAFFMKCDDDTFLNIPNLLHYLLGGTIPVYNDTYELFDLHTYRVLSPSNRLNSTVDYLAGHLFCTARPVAAQSSKWYMPYYMYPGHKYPKYLSGAAYVMSTDVVPRLYETALNTTFIHIEDVYLTGMCAEKMHLRRLHHPLFGYTRSKEWCSFRGSISQHEVKDDSMLEAYTFVTNTSIVCAPPPRYTLKRLRKPSSCV